MEHSSLWRGVWRLRNLLIAAVIILTAVVVANIVAAIGCAL